MHVLAAGHPVRILGFRALFMRPLNTSGLYQDDWHKTGLRLPRDLHLQLHEAAAASDRSCNSEIVARPQGSFNLASALTVQMSLAPMQAGGGDAPPAG